MKCVPRVEPLENLKKMTPMKNPEFDKLSFKSDEFLRLLLFFWPKCEKKLSLKFNEFLLPHEIQEPIYLTPLEL